MLLLKLVYRLLVAIGFPVYWLGSKLWSIFWHPKIIYRSSHELPDLKEFLKKIYPAIALIKRAHWPHVRQKGKVLTPTTPPVKYRKRKFIAKASLVMLALFLVGGIFIYFYVFVDLPSVDSLTTQPLPQTTHIRDRHGVELYKIYRNQNRTLVPLSQLPVFLQQATISIEDKEFYSHSGFSLVGIIRAVWINITDHQQQGGSTITQQLVKTALLSPEKTLQRKLRELVLAIATEMKYSKEQILEMYLNRVSFGGAAYGIEEASQTYFGKRAQDLTLPEATLLVGLPASPTSYSPYGAHPELAKNRQKEVLRRMVDDGYLTWEQAEIASATELEFEPQKIDIKAPHFVMYIKELLAEKYGVDAIEQGGLDVITTLDLETQQMAETAVAQEVAKVANLRIGNGAALVTNPTTGEILAMVGSKDYFDLKADGNVNVTTQARQPGSSIKPINYALAFIRGFTPASIIEDSPITYRIPGQSPYSPVNYDGKYHGRVTLRTALASSYNVPAVKILSANGVDAMIDLGQKMGITTWTERNRFGLALTLGGGEVTMLDMATAYGVFANAGARVDLYPILAIKDARGRSIEEFRCTAQAQKSYPSLLAAQAAEAAATEIISCESERVLDAKVAYLISDVLSDNQARTPAFGARSDLFIPNATVAVKTGTTNNLRDNWTIGYTRNFLVAVWVGNNDNSPMSYVASGVTGASPIWRRIVDNMLKKHPSTGFVPPADLIRVSVCTITGELGCSACPSKQEYFVPGTEPKQACSDESIKRLVEEKANPDPERDRILQGSSSF